MMVEHDEQSIRALFAPARDLEPSDEDVIRILGRTEERAKAKSGRRLRGWLAATPRRRRWLPRIATTGVACLAFGGTALAATGVWNPIVGTHSYPAETSDTPSPMALTEQLAILRRPATDADHSPEVEASLQADTLPAGVRLNSVRYLGPGEDGEATIVLTGEEPSSSFGSAKEPVCLVRPWRGFSGANINPGLGSALANCFDVNQLESGRAYATDSVVTREGQKGLTAGLVPDGVATVTAHFVNSPDVEVPVKDNFWELEIQGAQLHGSVTATTWKDAEGNVIAQKSEG